MKHNPTNKLKLFVENFLVYGLGGIIGKIIPILMIPIVTRLMPNSAYYGINDLSATIIAFGVAIAVFGMYDAMYRMFFEKDDLRYQQEICSTTLVFTAGMSLFVFLGLVLAKDWIAVYIFGDAKYDYLVYITAFAAMVNATNSIVSAPTRMQNKRKLFVMMNAISPTFSYAISIPLLLKGYYLVALPLASLLMGVSVGVSFFVINRHWFSLKLFRKEHLKPLLTIAAPLVPNFLVYWVFNSSDKLMITMILGAGATGVYSVGAKLGHASQLIYTAFSGGWQYFAFATMKEEGQVESNSKIFEYLGLISFAATAFVFSGSEWFYKLLFEGDYVEGFIIAPYLFLAPLLQMLFQVAANQFLVVKKTWPNLFIFWGGAVINVVLNLTLIPTIGIEGAAIATLCGYLIADIICVAVLCKMQLMVISKRFMMVSVLMAVFVVAWRFCFMQWMAVAMVVSCGYLLAILWLYRKDCMQLLKMIKKA